MDPVLHDVKVVLGVMMQVVVHVVLGVMMQVVVVVLGVGRSIH